ncbi:hypothetical protein KDD30_22490 (plasmid) [Photobacterium sp. GJ3]|uniref:hypothetical protein n=1 Tax=Photobacterium sp. GJ3 TaxID=2829502 RepID=UPI001B8D9A20|nr:hypothetical protein [Photobacterium sp. GJ3]QUJ69519.1 hypothetical protein KDD30_22490 [Photobacterium sp. GJ3]
MDNYKRVSFIYKSVRGRIDNDNNLKDFIDKEEVCKNIYAEIVQCEPAIMEWKVDYWGRYGKWFMPIITILAIVILPMMSFHLITGDMFDNYKASIIAVSFFLLPLVAFILGAEWFPVRYYQKITATGFYSYGVKTGNERRKKMAQYCMIGGFVIAFILLFVAGPMVFAGAGAASLSFLKLGSIPEPEPEESAWPWLGIYALIVKKPLLYDQYKMQTHGENELILTADQLETVIWIIREYDNHDLNILSKDDDFYYEYWSEVQDKMPFDDMLPQMNEISGGLPVHLF